MSQLKEKRKAQESLLARRAWMQLGIAALACMGVGTALTYHEQIGAYVKGELLSNPSFEDAKKHTNYRKRFLENLVDGISIPYCDGVVYDPTGKRIREWYTSELQALGLTWDNVEGALGTGLDTLNTGWYDLKTPDIPDNAGKNRHTKIFIGRKIFDSKMFADAEEIKQSIVAHEGRHAAQYGEGLKYLPKNALVNGLNTGSINAQVVYNIYEYDANAHEIARTLAGEFKVSNDYIEKRKRVFREVDSFLVNALKNASPEQEHAIRETRKAMGMQFPAIRQLQASE